jgi:aspartyl-tRNA(Asn)/glutamyl-tRNA(Gln) amidotransferase subunit C
MKVSEQDVAYVADLANLELTEEERGRMVQDMNSILEYVERLSELDTSGVEPMAQTLDRYAPGQAAARFAHTLRDDVVEGQRKSLPHAEALENAPVTDGSFFKVPKVIER